jgi:uncharacterized membrane protein (DUF106 family)
METKEELLKKNATLKMMTAILTGLIVFMIITSVYKTVNNGVEFFTFLPLFFLPMLGINFYNIRKNKKKLK